MMLYANIPGASPADLTLGEPVDLSNGTITIPQGAPGEYQVLLICGTEVAAYFFFWVESGAVVATPKLAG